MPPLALSPRSARLIRQQVQDQLPPSPAPVRRPPHRYPAPIRVGSTQPGPWTSRWPSPGPGPRPPRYRYPCPDPWPASAGQDQPRVRFCHPLANQLPAPARRPDQQVAAQQAQDQPQPYPAVTSSRPGTHADPSPASSSRRGSLFSPDLPWPRPRPWSQPGHRVSRSGQPPAPARRPPRARPLPLPDPVSHRVPADQDQPPVSRIPVQRPGGSLRPHS